MRSHSAEKIGPALLLAALLALAGLPPQGNASDPAERRLQAAQEKLQVSLDTENRARAGFEELKRSGIASDEVMKDYEIYLNRIQALVAENRRLVLELQAAMTATTGVGNQPGADERHADQTAQLDRQLDQALSAFDEMLLKEMDLIKAQAASKMTGLAEEAAAAAERLRKKGIELDTSGGEGESASADQAEEDSGAGEKSETAAEESPAQTDASAAGSDHGTAAETEAGGEGVKQAGGETGGDATRQASQDRSPAHSDGDDDIVARQLREAAEKETDPQLKEKLWKEYEAYKKNIRR